MMRNSTTILDWAHMSLRVLGLPPNRQGLRQMTMEEFGERVATAYRVGKSNPASVARAYAIGRRRGWRDRERFDA